MPAPTLIVITGPTGIGKSAVAVELARRLGTEIISADSRQIYRGLPITTAAPTPEQLAAVRHHLAGTLDLDQYYSAALFGEESLRILSDIFTRSPFAILCGGSMMYIDSVCYGIDELPDISERVREQVKQIYAHEGLEGVMERLRKLDPEYAATVDANNTRRVMHALEICEESGRTCTELRTGRKRERPFRILKFALTAPREVIFERINRRTELMVAQGMLAEVESVAHLRHLNSLNTVGVKELLRVIDGEWTLSFATERLKKNTRVYAKKQLNWIARDGGYRMIDITQQEPVEEILSAIAERSE